MTRVFISWSGQHSRQVATVLREHLRLILDVQPWMSTTDIAAGQRGLPEIERGLADAGFGIIVITPENESSPWINFEAGALSKAVGEEERRVAPLLVGYERETDLTGPIAQMQCNLLTMAGIRAVVQSIAAVGGHDESIALDRFDLAWPRLQEALAAVKAPSAAPQVVKEARPTADVLDEILVNVRAIRSDSEVGRLHQWVSSPTGRKNAVRQLMIAAQKQGVEVLDADFEDATFGSKARLAVDVPEGTDTTAIQRLDATAREIFGPDAWVVWTLRERTEPAHPYKGGKVPNGEDLLDYAAALEDEGLEKPGVNRELNGEDYAGEDR